MYRALTLLACVLSLTACSQPKFKTENVVLVTLDGMRWQEVFSGADSSFMKQQKVLKDAKLKEKYWRAEEKERRKALFPFLWTTIAAQGQVYGNRAAGCNVNVTNQMWFSYPGYNELLTGYADDERINSNDKKYNPNSTVLEFINNQEGFRGKVVAFCSWDVFPYIINDKRNGIKVSAGLQPASGAKLSEREKIINQLMPVIPNPLTDVRLDAFTFYYGLEYLKANNPRVIYFSFDETDDFAHQGEYAAYLNSAHYTDQFLKELWDYLQSEPVYQNKTTLFITVDHGRGQTAGDWKSHGKEIPGADQIWFAVIGPDTPSTGEQKGGQYYQNQVATTLSSLLGLKFSPSHKPGEPVTAMMTRN